MLLTEAVSLGFTMATDLAAAQTVAPLWVEPLRPVALGVALLGGIELTALIVFCLAVFLVRRGFRSEAWGLVAFPLVELAEFAYKRIVQHPGPIEFAHGDGPSLTMLLERGAGVAANSYPSGHTVRAVLVYGLLAFVMYRLAPYGSRLRMAVPVAVVIIGLVAFDRLYLGNHWASDVVGGLLLGGVGLAGAAAWLDHPRAKA